MINAKLRSRSVYQFFVDNGSLVNILHYNTYKKMGNLEKEITSERTQIYRFIGDSVKVKGVIKLLLILGEEQLSATHIFKFLVIDQPTCYNSLLGRPLLREMRVVTFIFHLAMKSPTLMRVGCVKGCQCDSREWYSKMIKII